MKSLPQPGSEPRPGSGQFPGATGKLPRHRNDSPEPGDGTSAGSRIAPCPRIPTGEHRFDPPFNGRLQDQPRGGKVLVRRSGYHLAARDS